MDAISYKTPFLKAGDHKEEWLLVDAKNQVLGRMAARVAIYLRGKHKATYTPHMACGAHVVVINAEAVRLTGKKSRDKTYIRHTGYPGGQRSTTVQQVLEKAPERIIERAVRGMLPKTRLGRQLFRNCHVYAGETHPHEAQNPQLPSPPIS